VIYAGVNGYLDPLPVNRVRAFEEGLLGHIRGKHPEILEDIRTSRDLSDATGAKLKGAVEGFAKSFEPPRPAPFSWPRSRRRQVPREGCGCTRTDLAVSWLPRM
jgi:hypothetical protein